MYGRFSDGVRNDDSIPSPCQMWKKHNHERRRKYNIIQEYTVIRPHAEMTRMQESC